MTDLSDRINDLSRAAKSADPDTIGKAHEKVEPVVPVVTEAKPDLGTSPMPAPKPTR